MVEEPDEPYYCGACGGAGVTSGIVQEPCDECAGTGYGDYGDPSL